MKLVVCVKQVASLGDEVELTDGGTAVDPDYLELDVNEWDVYAVEEALRLGEADGDSEVVVVAVGGEDATEALRRALAMGAQRGILVAGSTTDDPLSVARALAGGLRDEAFDLVLTGVQSSDSVQAATGTMLAQLLGLPCVAVVKKVDYDGARRKATVHRELEGGLIDVVEVDTPAVLTIQTGINEPRYATLRAIKAAKDKEITTVDAKVDGEPCYRIRRMFVPDRGDGAEILSGDPAAIARQIADLVRGRLS